MASQEVASSEKNLIAQIASGKISLYDAINQQATGLPREKKADIKSRAALPNPVLEERDLEQLKKLPTIFASTQTPEVERALKPTEVDSLVGEFVSLKKISSLTDGRLSQLKKLADMGMNYGGYEPETKAELVSEVHQAKICRTIRGGDIDLDPEKIREVLGRRAAQFFDKTVTTIERFDHRGQRLAEPEVITEHTLNKSRLTQALIKGKITLDELALCQYRRPVILVFTDQTLREEK